MPADLGWSDVGSWDSVWDVLDHDAAGNATDGPVVVMDSRNSLVRSDELVLTTVVGLPVAAGIEDDGGRRASGRTTDTGRGAT